MSQTKEFFKDAKDDVKTIIDHSQIKDVLEDAKDDVKTIIDSTQIEDFVIDAKSDLNMIVKDLEYRALKTQYAIQEKYSKSKNKKNEIVIKSAEALVEAINNVKCALAECEKEEA